MANYHSCIVADGAHTAVGLRALPMAAAVRSGISQLVSHPRFFDITGEPFVVGMDQTLEEFDSRKRMLSLATSALKEVFEALEGRFDPQMEVPIFIGVRDEMLNFTNDDAAWLATGLARVAHSRCNARVSTVSSGNASGLIALQMAQKAVEVGNAQISIAGGVDSHIDPLFLEQLDELGRCKSVANKWGYPPGEGAAMLGVSTTTFAKRAGLPDLAGLVGGSNSVEFSHLGSDQICMGTGLANVISSALEYIDWPTEMIGTQYCDINGEFFRTDEFMYAIQRIPAGTFRAINEYIAPADSWGDVGAASGPLFATLAVESARRGYAQGNLVLLWAGSENGKRASSVLYLH